jgi:hypothetical protein
MRYPAGQPANRVHLLRPAILFLLTDTARLGRGGGGDVLGDVDGPDDLTSVIDYR